MITLRDNQVEPIRKAVEFFTEKKPKPSLIVLPTAWGKSILTAFVAKNTTDKLIVLQPSKELLEQNYNKYVKLIGGTNAGVFSASFGRKEVAQITYATIGSIKNYGKQFKELGFTKMLIDEAHLYPRDPESMLGKFLAESGITHVLGITATPVKLQTNFDASGMRYSKLVMLTSKSKLGNFFKEIIHVGQVSEMVAKGYWSPLTYEVGSFDGQLLRWNTTGSEYTEESVQLAFNANGGMQQVIDVLNAHRERKHVLAFVPSVTDAINLAMQYPGSAAVYGDMDKHEREAVISAFRSGRIRVIFNVRVLSTGFDYTGIDGIVLGISTASIALYYQILGRGTRIEEGKRDCLVVDLGGNVEKFGRVEDIVFEKGSVWRMYGSDGRLLSGIPITDIGSVTRADVAVKDKRMAVEVMPFGKFKDKRMSEVPKSYLRWMVESFKWTAENENLRKAVIQQLR